MQVFPQVSVGFGAVDLQGKKGRKEEHKPLHFVHVLSSKESRMLEVKPLGAAPSPGSHTPRGRQGKLAGMSGTRCSHPSRMPADGFSRRAWRQLGDFAAESGILQCRQRPRRWHQALQLHNAWHTPSGLRSQHRQACGDVGSLWPLAHFQLMASLEACVFSAGKADK